MFFLIGATYPPSFSVVVVTLIVAMILLGMALPEIRDKALSWRQVPLLTAVNVRLAQLSRKPSRLSASRLMLAVPLLVYYAMGAFFGTRCEQLCDRARMLAQTGKSYGITVLVLNEFKRNSYQVEFIGEIISVDGLSTGGRLPDGSLSDGAFLHGYSADGSRVAGSSLINMRASGMKARILLPQGNEGHEATPGTLLLVQGKFNLPKTPMNPGEFDYRDYLAHRGIFVEIKSSSAFLRNQKRLTGGVLTDGLLTCGLPTDELQIGGLPINGLSLGKRLGLSIKQTWLGSLFAVRRAFDSRIDNALPEREAKVLKSILLSKRSDIDEEQKALFKEVGLYRLLGTAGLHVDFVAKVSEKLAKKILKRKSLSQTISVLVALFYVILSGFSVGSTRAFIFCLSRVASPRLMRKHDNLHALSVAAILVGTAIPFPLKDAGFQLSFAAVLGAILGHNLTRSRVGGSFGVILALLPLLMYHFQEVSLAGFLLAGFWNVCIAVLMLSAPIVLALPARLFGWVPFLIIRGLEVQSRIAALLPFASMIFPKPTALDIILYYLFLPAALFLLYGSKRAKRFARAVLLILAVAIFLSSLLRFYPPWPQVMFLSVGQGDSALIRVRDKAILFDTGTESAFKNTVVPYLSREGIREIDLLVLSHLHHDHAGGISLLGQLMSQGAMRLGTVLCPPKTKGEVLREFQRGIGLEAEAQADESPEIIEAKEVESYRLGPVFLEILWSGRGGPDGDENVNAIVVRILFQRLSCALEFWGDSPKSVVSALENDLAEKRRGFQRVIVKIPHHGSVHSLSQGFYHSMKGHDAVISVGPNSYGHPSPLVMYTARENGATIWRTDKQGAIGVRTILGRVRLFSFVRN